MQVDLDMLHDLWNNVKLRIIPTVADR
jgi:hypothetical protein